MHLAITEKPVLPNGKLNSTYPTTWIENDNFTLNDVNVKEGIDYHMFQYDDRKINLDTIIGDSEQVITGVRFALVEAHIQLQVRFTLYDKSSGKLIGQDGNWKQIDDLLRTPVILENCDSPIKQNLTSDHYIPEKLNGHYIEFLSTSWFKDAAQTTIPFIETLPIQPKNDVALSGIGLYHKSVPWYGGFIGLEIIPYDFQILPQRIRSSNSAMK